jgi:hypothetical protein
MKTPDQKPFLFVHIPKTAGTSFRVAARDYFGRENSWFDYGKDDPNTSPQVKKWFYKNHDLYEFGKAMESEGCKFLGGHFHLAKFASLFESERVVSFVRDPIEQLVSHYRHHYEKLGYKKGFDEYSNDKRFLNIHSRMLSLESYPLNMIGFLGVTERYTESLALFNKKYGLGLEDMFENKNKNKNENEKEVEVHNTVIDRLAKDDELYKHVNVILDQQKQTLEAGQSLLRKGIQERNDRIVRGFAYFHDSDRPVNVKASYNGEVIQERLAVSARPGLMLYNPSRGGYIGFEFYQKQLGIAADKVELTFE